MPETLSYTVASTCLSEALIASSSKGVCAILLGEPTADLLADAGGRFANCQFIRDDAALEPVARHFSRCVGAQPQPWSLPLDMRGTQFQYHVWQTLQSIAPGSTVSYSMLAQMLGKPRACRAVASACAANPLAIVVPCHRVLRQDGTLGGYRWGLHRKQQLLQWEKQRLALDSP